MNGRIRLGRQALRAALETRHRAGASKSEPICVYDLAEKLGVEVRFCLGKSLGGMYAKASKTILVPTFRPPGRQAFTCAHELAHWFFGHGTRIDHLDDIERDNDDNPEERLANAFAGCLLMPPWAVQEAFARRNWQAAGCTPFQAYTVAGQLSVGYETLVQHSRWSLNLITEYHAKELLKTTPKQLRQSLLGADPTRYLVVADHAWTKVSIDLQVDDMAILPPATSLEGRSVQRVEAHQLGSWAAFIRVCRKDFAGRSIYRHLEDPDVDENAQLICEENLSYAWGRAFLTAMEYSQDRLTPLLVSIGGFGDSVAAEDARIRQELDAALAEHHKCSCAESAFTIFPYRYWNRSGHPPRQELFEWFRNMLPRLKARDRRNCYGTYFERLIDSTGVKGRSGDLEIVTINQLDHIIDDWRRERKRPKRPRQSALQGACFDPAKDHTGQAVRGFPCLQQLSFAYDRDGLALHAYYPTQYIFDRAYGNYLGLSHLGHFMAHELQLAFVRLNCYIGRPELGKITKMRLRELADEVGRLLPPDQSCGAPESQSAGVATRGW